MGTPISFSAALNQLGNGAYHLVQATWRAPFSGGRARMVSMGLPVLFLTAGVGAVIWGVASAILRRMGNAWASHSTPPQPQIVRVHHFYAHIPPPKTEAGATENADEARSTRVPLPAEAAKERNNAFGKLIKLLDELVIDPWVLKNQKLLEKGKEIDPLFKTMIESPDELRAFLRSMALWQFGIHWEKGEALYLKGQLPPPPSLETIVKEIKALELEEAVQARLLALASPLTDDQTVDVKVESFIREARQVKNGKGQTLAALALRLEGILTQQPRDEGEVQNEQAKALYTFATGMNDVVANSLIHVTGMIQGFLSFEKKTSPKKQEAPPAPALPLAPPAPPPVPTESQPNVKEGVEAVIATVSKELQKNYSTPLYTKQREGWEKVATRDLDEESPTSCFLGGTIDDTALLTAPETEHLPTDQLSGVFFLRAMKIIEEKNEFEEFIQRIPESLLHQIQPTLVGLLDQSLGMVKKMNLERTTVRIFEFAGQLLDCCEAVKGCGVAPAAMTRSFMGPQPTENKLIPALSAGGVDKDRLIHLSSLAGTTPNNTEQEAAIILKLGKTAHKNVDPKHRDPGQVERDWLEDKLTKIKRLVRENTTDYDGQWLATLLTKQGMGSQAGWITALLSAKERVQAFFPFLANVFEFLMLGAQGLIEKEGIARVQKALDEFTSPGPLSTFIAETMVKSFLNLSTTDDEWGKKLPFLQQIYQFLSPKEQALIDTHLKYLYKDEKLTQRTADLKGGSPSPAQRLLTEEAEYHTALAELEKANEELKKMPETNKEKIQELERAYHDLKKNLGLKQFERVKGLVLFVADHHLKPIFNFRGGGAVLTAVMTVIQEAFNLLRYKKVVKHLIFTGVDLLIKELEITSGLKPADEDTFHPKTYDQGIPSIFEIAEKHNLDEDLMRRVANFASNCNREGMAGWLASLNYAVSDWTGPAIWGAIKGEFNDDARITSKWVADTIAEKFFDFGKDPNGLSQIIIEALTEHVADPRPKPPAPSVPPALPAVQPEDEDDFVVIGGAEEERRTADRPPERQSFSAKKPDEPKKPTPPDNDGHK